MPSTYVTPASTTAAATTSAPSSAACGVLRAMATAVSLLRTARSSSGERACGIRVARVAYRQHGEPMIANSAPMNVKTMIG